jgi:UDP-N-acetyl-D-glucosamine dehydrogenase
MTSQPPEDAVGAAIHRFETRPWTAGIIGLGYVGLPLAVSAVDAGLRAIGFDVSDALVARLGAGSSHVEDVGDDALGAALAGGLTVTSDESELARADALFLCIPSPLGRHRQPDMSYIEAAAATVARVVRPGMLVSLESTSYPGTTEDVVLPRAVESGLELDREVFVAFSPERVDPGNARSLVEIPKIVGGVTPTSGRVAAAAYRRLVHSVHVVSSARVAEMAKLLENTYRAVNIGLVNEIAQLSHAIGIDIWEVVEAAATKPFGFQPFYPGPGVGGHCIPLDPQFLAWRAREAKFATRFIDLAEQVNSSMPEYAAARIGGLLNDAGRPLHDTRILAVGVAYKPNVSDDRESPAWEVIDALAARGARVEVHDPLVAPARLRARGYEVVERLDELEGYAMAVVLTDHDAVDLEALAAAVPLVFDTRGAFRRRGVAAANVTAL